MTKTSLQAQKMLTMNEQTIADGAIALIKKGESLIINDSFQLEEAATLARSCKSVAKKIEDIRKHKVKAPNDEVAAINNTFKRGMIDPLTACAKLIEGRMLEYTRELQKQAEAERQEETASLFDTIDDAWEDLPDDDGWPVPATSHNQSRTVIPEVIRSMDGAVGSTRKSWVFEVTDIVELANSRPDLVEVNAVKINAEIRGKDGAREIPGLRIYQDEKMVVR